MLRSKFPLPELVTDKIKPSIFGEARRFKLLPSHVTLPLSKTLMESRSEKVPGFACTEFLPETSRYIKLPNDFRLNRSADKEAGMKVLV